MKQYKEVGQWLSVVFLLIGVTACGQENNRVLKVGVTVGAHAQVVEMVAIEAAKQGVYLEPKNASLAVMVIATRAKDKDNANYKKFMEICHSQAIDDFIEKTFNGTIEPAR